MWCGCLEFGFLVIATASSASIAILGFILRKTLSGKCALFSVGGVQASASNHNEIFMNLWGDSNLCGLVLVIGVGGSILCVLTFIYFFFNLSKPTKSWKISTLSVFFETLFLLLTGICIGIVYFGIHRFCENISGTNKTICGSNQAVINVNDRLVKVEYMYSVFYSVQVCLWVFMLSLLGEMCCSIYRLLMSAGKVSYQQTVAADSERSISNLYAYSRLI
uniref:Uncharacterized protein n=1 Tax=Schistocephalus solidus TaxID=70667 RepID=A0A0X3NPI5_SCHSO